jgi:hypothetical protein
MPSEGIKELKGEVRSERWREERWESAPRDKRWWIGRRRKGGEEKIKEKETESGWVGLLGGTLVEAP